MNNRLFIVTPTLGQSEFLDRSIACVHGLGLQVDHLLACPAPVVAELEARYPQCRVVADAGKAGGIYGALNIAFQHAPAEYDWYTYINDDDELAPGFATIVAQQAAKNNPEPVVYGDVRRIDGKGKSLGFITTETDPRFLGAILHNGISPLNQQGMLFSRAVVEAMGGFDQRYKLSADLDYWVRAYARGFPFRYARAEVGRFRIREGQLSGNIDLTRAELADITKRHLPVAPSSSGKFLARMRYRVCNFPRYLERFTHTGFRSAESVLASESK